MRLESVCTKCRMYRGVAKNSSTPMRCEVDGKVSDVLFAPERLPKGCLMEDEYRSLLLRRLDKCMKCEHCKTSTALLAERYLCGISDRWFRFFRIAFSAGGDQEQAEREVE